MDSEKESSWQNMGYDKVFGRTEAPQTAPTKPQRVFTDITAMGLDENTKTAPIQTVVEAEPAQTLAAMKPAPRRFSAPALVDPSSPISLDILEPTDIRAFLNEGSWGNEDLAEPEAPEPAEPTKPIVEPPAEDVEVETRKKLSRSALRERLKKLPRPGKRTDEPAETVDVPDLPAPEPESSATPTAAVIEPTAIVERVVEPVQRIRPTMFDDASLAAGVELRTEGASFSKMKVADIARVIQRGAWAGAIEVHDPSGEWFSLVLHPVFAHVEAELTSQTRAALDVVTAEVERSTRRRTATKPGLDHSLRRIPPAIPGLIEPGEWLEHEEEEVAVPGGSLADQSQGLADQTQMPGGSLADQAQSLTDQTQSLTDQTRSLADQTQMPGGSLADQTQSLTDQTQSLTDQTRSLTDQTRSLTDQTQSLAGRNRMSSTQMMLAVLVGTLVILAIWFAVRPDKSPPVVKPTPVAPIESIQLATLLERRATAMTQGVAALRAKSTEELSAAVRDLIQRKNYGDAWDLISELRTREPDSKEWVVREIEISLGSQEWSEAREQAIHALSRFDEPDIAALYRRAVQNDSRLFEKPITLTQNGDFDRIRALGGGRSVSLKMKSGDQTVYAFKPAQLEWGDGWKSEVAAWRLCELVPCAFDVPWSRPARISRNDLMAMYPLDNEKQRTYSERFTELTWSLELGPDGVEREYLYGVLKTWVPHFADWPIEYTHIWQNWLAVGSNPEILNQPLRKAIRPLMTYKDGEYYRNLLTEEGDATTASVARGLSDVVTFDYLTNNWDRFSILEPYYGVNNQFANGRFVSIDNGAAFHVQPSIRVDARFEPVQRFSRSFIRGLKLLQPNWSDAILFESPSDLDKQRLEVFWQRRDAVLGRVTELVEQHGEQKVLFFD